jgi:hypothetical protein
MILASPGPDSAPIFSLDAWTVLDGFQDVKSPGGPSEKRAKLGTTIFKAAPLEFVADRIWNTHTILSLHSIQLWLSVSVR